MHRLVFLYPGNIGGVDSYIRNLSVFLQKENIEHHLVIYKYHNGISNKIRRTELFTEINISSYSSQLAVYKMIGSCISDNDVLICNDSVELVAVNYLKLPNKLIYILHGDLAHYSNQLTERQNIMDKVICVSKGLKNKYSQLFPHLSFGIGFPLVPFETDRKRNKPSSNKALFLGRFQYEKGADLFLRLVHELEHEVEWEVIAARQGSDKKLLDQLPAHITVGFDMDKVAVMESLEKSNFLIFPSRSEGFGMAVLEGLMKGVIPVVLDIPIGIPDQVIDGYNGLIFNEDKWANSFPILRSLLNNKEEQSRLIINGESLIAEKFSPEKNFQNLLKELSMVQVGKNKCFTKTKVRLLEKILPCLVFAFLKYLNTIFARGKRSNITT